MRLAAFVILAALVPWEPAEAQKPRAERPTLAVGDKWIRSESIGGINALSRCFRSGPPGQPLGSSPSRGQAHGPAGAWPMLQRG